MHYICYLISFYERKTRVSCQNYNLLNHTANWKIFRTMQQVYLFKSIGRRGFLLKKLLEEKNFIYIPLLWSTIKIERFFFHKRKRRKLYVVVTKFFSVSEYVHFQMQAFIVSLTAVVKICSIFCLFCCWLCQLLIYFKDKSFK